MNEWMADNLDQKLRLPRIHFRVLLHAANMRHGTNGFTSLPKEGVLRIFSLWKIRRLWPGLNRRTWVAKGSTLPPDHWSRNYYMWIGEVFEKLACCISHLFYVAFMGKTFIKGFKWINWINSTEVNIFYMHLVSRFYNIFIIPTYSANKVI